MPTPIRTVTLVVVAVVLWICISVDVAHLAGLLIRVSPNSGGEYPVISSDGRYVAFLGSCGASVYDHQNGQTTCVAAASGGPSISADARYVAFGASCDVFVHDRQFAMTTRVSVSADGSRMNGCSSISPTVNSISADGRYVVFNSESSFDVFDIYVHDRDTGVTTRVSEAPDGSPANGPSSYESISGDGRYVAFRSLASNLISGDTNGRMDIFVHDRQTGEITRVSVASDGSQANNESNNWVDISTDGRYIVFTSDASNLVSGDTNGSIDIFVHDRETAVTTRVSVASDGSQANNSSSDPTISPNGRYIAFYSSASNLVSGDTNGRDDIFVHDRQTAETTRISVASDGSQANDHSVHASISDNGYVAFSSRASNLVSGDTNGLFDIFVTEVSGPSPNQPPTVNAGGAYGGTEGTPVPLNNATGSDADGNLLTYDWTVNDPSLCTFSNPAVLHPTLTCVDNGNFIVTLAVNDGTDTVSSGATVTVANVAPTAGSTTGLPTAPILVGNAVNANTSFSDPGTTDAHTCAINWGDSSTANGGTVEGNQCSGSHIYTNPGVYTVELAVTDDDGGSDSSTYQYVVVYNPSAGFVSGAGWFHAEQGRASFGFNVKYDQNATAPQGDLRFSLDQLDLKSQSFDWLVIVGNKAIFQGLGTLGGTGQYRYIVTVVDHGTPGRDSDTFRIRIWDNSNTEVYDSDDSDPKLPDGADPLMTIDAGNIVVHLTRAMAASGDKVVDELVVIGNPPFALLEVLGIRVNVPHERIIFLPTISH